MATKGQMYTALTKIKMYAKQGGRIEKIIDDLNLNDVPEYVPPVIKLLDMWVHMANTSKDDCTLRKCDIYEIDLVSIIKAGRRYGRFEGVAYYNGHAFKVYTEVPVGAGQERFASESILRSAKWSTERVSFSDVLNMIKKYIYSYGEWWNV